MTVVCRQLIKVNFTTREQINNWSQCNSRSVTSLSDEVRLCTLVDCCEAIRAAYVTPHTRPSVCLPVRTAVCSVEKNPCDAIIYRNVQWKYLWGETAVCLRSREKCYQIMVCPTFRDTGAVGFNVDSDKMCASLSSAFRLVFRTGATKYRRI